MDPHRLWLAASFTCLIGVYSHFCFFLFVGLIWSSNRCWQLIFSNSIFSWHFKQMNMSENVSSIPSGACSCSSHHSHVKPQISDLLFFFLQLERKLNLTKIGHAPWFVYLPLLFVDSPLFSESSPRGIKPFTALIDTSNTLPALIVQWIKFWSAKNLLTKLSNHSSRVFVWYVTKTLFQVKMITDKCFSCITFKNLFFDVYLAHEKSVLCQNSKCQAAAARFEPWLRCECQTATLIC